MKFDTLKDLERAFTAGKIGNLPDRVTVGDTTFNFIGHRTKDIRSIYSGHKPVAIYQPAEHTPHDHCIVFAWTIDDESRIIPGSVITVPQSLSLTKDMFNVSGSQSTGGSQGNISPPINTVSGQGSTSSHPEYEEVAKSYGSTEEEERDMNFVHHLSNHPLELDHIEQPKNPAADKMLKMKDEMEARTVGQYVDIVLIGFNNEQPIHGKTDTGATFCSLHADNIKVKKDPLGTENEEVASFTYNGTNYTMNVEQYQAISSADGGTTQRPVVRFNVRIKDKVVRDVLINLNDRSDMDDKMLVGMNLLQQAKLVVDPSIEEGINWGYIARKVAISLK